MKSLIFAAALLTGSAAVAQDRPLPAADGQTVAPGNSRARSATRAASPVVSDPATAPAGANQAPPPAARAGRRPPRTRRPPSRPSRRPARSRPARGP